MVGVAAGAILQPANRSRIRASGRVVWLRGRPESLIRRQGRPGWDGRPRLARDMAAWMMVEAEARSPLYAEVAAQVVDVDDRTPDEIVDEILASPAEAPTTPEPGSPTPAAADHVLPGRYRAVVFDLDGLLVETETIWLEAKAQLFRAHGMEFSVDDHRAVLGTSEDYTARTFVRRFGLGGEQVGAMTEEYLGIAGRIFAAGVETREGATELIAALRGRYPLGSPPTRAARWST